MRLSSSLHTTTSYPSVHCLSSVAQLLACPLGCEMTFQLCQLCSAAALPTPAAVHASPDGGVPGLAMSRQDGDTQLVLGGCTLWLGLTQAWTPVLLSHSWLQGSLPGPVQFIIQAFPAHKSETDGKPP